MNELKPCPFCGSKDVFAVPTDAFWGHVVSCNNCGASGPMASTEEEAIAGWNDRKGESNG